MKIGIISDIHCDIIALRMALEQMQPVDQVLCAGDLVLQYRFSNEVVALIRESDIPSIRGNHDEVILSSAGAAMRASGSIHPENLTFVEQLPDVLEFHIDGKHLVMMHTSRLDPTGGGRDLGDGAEAAADVLIVGHTHQPIVTQVGKTLVINPGSLGQPRNPDFPHRRTYAILDTQTWQADIHDFDLPLA